MNLPTTTHDKTMLFYDHYYLVMMVMAVMAKSVMPPVFQFMNFGRRDCLGRGRLHIRRRQENAQHERRQHQD